MYVCARACVCVYVSSCERLPVCICLGTVPCLASSVRSYTLGCFMLAMSGAGGTLCGASTCSGRRLGYACSDAATPVIVDVREHAMWPLTHANDIV